MDKYQEKRIIVVAEEVGYNTIKSPVTTEGVLVKALKLLKEIDGQGSLKKAALKMGLSYRKAWGDIRDAEDFLSFSLIETVRGGKDGGLSKLTVEGKDLIAAFNELHNQFDLAIHRITRQFFNKLNKKEKEGS